jgi:hypothetical protein
LFGADNKFFARGLLFFGARTRSLFLGARGSRGSEYIQQVLYSIPSPNLRTITGRQTIVFTGVDCSHTGSLSSRGCRKLRPVERSYLFLRTEKGAGPKSK